MDYAYGSGLLVYDRNIRIVPYSSCSRLNVDYTIMDCTISTYEYVRSRTNVRKSRAFKIAACIRAISG